MRCCCAIRCSGGSARISCTLPENIVGGTFDIFGLRIEASRLLAGVVALLVTLGLHLLLTRTSLGSKMLAVAEDSTAAQLMGIRPDTMQAIAWAIAAGATGLAGALIATFFYIVPTVGETLGIVAFVTVSLGGFGSVPGALVAGLLIGVIESLSAYLIGAVYKDIVVYVPVPRLPLVPAAGPDGQDVMRRADLWLSVVLALVVAYPLLFSTPFQQRLGALVLLYAIAASAWNIVGGYAGQVSVGHVVFFGCGAYAAMGAYAHFGLSPLVGIPAGIVVAVAIAAVIGVPTLRLSGHYFSMATIAVAELVRLIVTNTDYLGAAVGLSGPTVPRNVFDLSFISALPYYYLFLAVLVITLGITWWMTNSRMGFYLRAIRDSERAARSLGAPASRTKLYAFMLSAGLTSVAGALYAMMFGFVDPESGLGILISVKILIMAALGGAGLLFGPLVGAAILVPLEEISNNLLGGKGAGLTFVRLRRDHRADRALSAGRHSDADQAAAGPSAARRRSTAQAGSQPCSLKPATSPRPSAASRRWTPRQRDAGAGRHSRPDRAERRRQIHLLQLPDRRSCRRPRARCCSKATTSRA